MQKTKNTGITLVALVITIIILLILAGISIASLTGSQLFENAKLAKEKSDAAQEKEEGILADYENKIGEYVDSSRDTITISKEEYNKIKNANVYSENEIEIGTWIDGKPLYRKVINFGALPNNTTKTVAHNIQNVDNIHINFGSSYVNANGTSLSLDHANTGFVGQWYAHVNSSSITMWAGTDRTAYSAYVVLEYTKTTDTATNN